MQFTHPNILYALVALIIPILVHLFQLRKFEKVPFTNVAFLKEVILQTRKSSQLKKWLILCTRLLALACIILAFAEPYLASFDTSKKKRETVIYLDNSFSMQAKGSEGALLTRAVQDILLNSPDEEISIFTNDRTYKNIRPKNIKNELLDLPYASEQLDYKTVFLKGKQLFSSEKNTRKGLILISDFQKKNERLNIENNSTITVELVKLSPENVDNIGIERVRVLEENVNNITIEVQVNNATSSASTLSLYNGNDLIGKAAIENDKAVTFNIAKKGPIQGILKLTDNALEFDNTFFFNIDVPEKIKVMAINEGDDSFLKKIFTEEEFIFSSFQANNVDYNTVASQNLIILNELKSIPVALSNTLKEYQKQGMNLLVIPSTQSNISSYNGLLNSFGTKITNTTRVTEINFEHPILKNVFEKNVSNFQYPQVFEYYNLETFGSKILSFENGSPFIYRTGNTFGLTASINNENSNFKNSPLIVPVFYNIGKSSYKIPELYYTIGKENSFDIKATLGNDEILTMQNGDKKFIPLQQTKTNGVNINTSTLPDYDGIYNILNGDLILNQVSYNFNRSESKLEYLDLNNESISNVEVHDSVPLMFEKIKSENQISALWKWFVIFALAFLLIEILLLKFLK